MNENTNLKKTSAASNLLIPYIIAIIGSVLAVVANFIQYITASSTFWTWKTSVFELIVKTIESPETALAGTGDKIIFGLIVAGIVFSLLAVLLVLTKKMKSAIVFAVLASLPFLSIHNAWIHLVGIGLTVVGAIWYLIAKRKNPAYM